MLTLELRLRLRLPLTWARVRAGEVAVWRARRIAQRVLGEAADVVAYIDAEVAPRAHSIGLTGLDRLLEAAMLTLHVEQYEIEQMEALETRHVTADREADRFGITEYVIRADQVDLAAFDTMIGRLAAALKRDGSFESLDVRRSIAVGIIADPTRRGRRRCSTTPARRCRRRGRCSPTSTSPRPTSSAWTP
ncbi:hypothetical protein [Nocardioides flavescens]|uniref:DUF222 domain-containing protein n=1 Tax=Nocardioides flavescens TaxID=2691959 RepID=A0A6L7EX82_9ACTN|nr:hypothetical protein [Nocardioides flavescens]MXG88875.1 hypothetical protein [Nocardioides flavescens]